MQGAQEAIESAESGLDVATPRQGPSRPARIVSQPAAEPVVLSVDAVEIPPPLAPLTAADLVTLAAAFALHAILFAVMLERTNRIGGGGSDIEAMGVEIVMVSPALESRSLDGVRDRAMTGAVVGPDDGSVPIEAQTPTADRREIEESRKDPRPANETAAAPADLVVPEWVQPAPAENAPAAEPVIARANADGEQQAALRPTTSDEAKSDAPPQQAPAQSPSSPADAITAALPGGFSARGRDVIDGASAVMAAARAGRKDKYGGEVYAALRASVPRPVQGIAGKVTVEFVVAPTGGVLSSRIRASTGSRVLEEAAMAAVRAARVPKPPPELIPSDLVYSMEYTFR